MTGPRSALFVAVAVVVGLTLAASAAGRDSGETIAFASSRDGRQALWEVTAAGGGLRRLTTSAVPARPCRCRSGDADAHPAWSPDGRRLAFTRGARIVVVVASGGTDRSIPAPPGTEDAEPVWSSRGRLAFVRERLGSSGFHQIVTSDADGGRQRVLLTTRFLPRSLAWSSDGSRLAYVVRYRHPILPYVVGLFHVDDEGGRPRFALRSAGFGEVAWAPDGRRLVVASAVPGAEPYDPYRLFTIRLSDSGIEQITEPPGARTADASPRWSPDGRSIVFVRTDLRRSRIFSVRPDGGGERLLVADASGPVWSSDGTRIGFVDGLSGNGRALTVSVMRRDGSGRRALAALVRPADGADLGPQSWRPWNSEVRSGGRRSGR